jgi:hypothetical protein
LRYASALAFPSCLLQQQFPAVHSKHPARTPCGLHLACPFPDEVLAKSSVTCLSKPLSVFRRSEEPLRTSAHKDLAILVLRFCKFNPTFNYVDWLRTNPHPSNDTHFISYEKTLCVRCSLATVAPVSTCCSPPHGLAIAPMA